MCQAEPYMYIVSIKHTTQQLYGNVMRHNKKLKNSDLEIREGNGIVCINPTAVCPPSSGENQKFIKTFSYEFFHHSQSLLLVYTYQHLH